MDSGLRRNDEKMLVLVSLETPSSGQADQDADWQLHQGVPFRGKPGDAGPEAGISMGGSGRLPPNPEPKIEARSAVEPAVLKP